MKELIDHEIFEIEVLNLMKNNKFLKNLVFLGGTMLRLCHELPRYSMDLDFWFAKIYDEEKYFADLKDFLEKHYSVTDSANKFNTMLFELKSPLSTKKLKIEIRKIHRRIKSEDKIAFSPHSSNQVLLKALTLKDTMDSKVEAALSRNEIRDFFDIEFLIRRGIPLPKDEIKNRKLLKACRSFSKLDFKVKLGSILSRELRDYHNKNGFKFLEEKLLNVEK